MSLSKPENFAHAQTAVSCNICDNDAPGEHYCIDCKSTLCTKCEIPHRNLPSTKDHKVVLRTQIGETETRKITCTDHGDDVIFHCEKCKIPVCGKCVTNQHRGHEMSDLNSLWERKIEMLQCFIAEVRTDLLPSLNSKQEEIEKEKENYKTKIHQTEKSLIEENQSVLKELSKSYNEKMKKLKETEEVDLMVFDKYSQQIKMHKEIYERRVSQYQKAIQQRSLIDVLEYESKLQPIPLFGKIPEFPKPPLFSSGNIKRIGSNIGNLQESVRAKEIMPLNNKPVKIIANLTSPLKGWPSICISKKGNVFLGGTESKKVVVLNDKGQIMWKRYARHSSLALAVTEMEDIIITSTASESTTVRRLVPGDKEENILDLSPTYSNGVSVTNNQQLLICTKTGRVYRTNMDGSNAAVIYCGRDIDGSALHAVENVNGDIYITDKPGSALVILRSDRKQIILKNTTKGEKFGKLVGLAVDKRNRVVVADSSRDCVYIIDENYQAQKLVDIQHGVNKPRFLAVDHENKLWITQYDGSILVFQY